LASPGNTSGFWWGHTPRLPNLMTTISKTDYQAAVDRVYLRLQEATDEAKRLEEKYPSKACEELRELTQKAEAYAFELGNALDCC
jgi:hypothetical protein